MRLREVSSITYYRQNNNIERIYYKNSTQSYSMYTHVNHITLDYFTDGEVKKIIYQTDDSFCIMHDFLHAVESLNGRGYSMIRIYVQSNII